MFALGISDFSVGEGVYPAAQLLRVARGLGRERSLFQDPLHARLDRLEPTLARLRRRFPDQVVLPGWVGRGA